MDKIFLGRQPIYDKGMRVRAYELLYRAGPDATAGSFDGDRATSSVIVNTLTEFPDIERVQILVDGEIVESIGGHILILQPLQRKN